MPSWKKVITNGSNASLNSLSVDTNITAQSFTGSLFGTASYALTASYVMNGGGGGTPLYTHEQTSSSDVWTIIHNLGTSFPIITVYDDGNNVIIPQEITSLTTSSLSITFPLSIAGYASIAGGSFSSVPQGITQNESIVNSLIFG
jgi:hypothetical protein